MIRTLAAIGISLALSAALLYGTESLNQFAFIVLGALNILAWAALLTGSIKGDIASKTRKRTWQICICDGIQIFALISTDHPWLAASYLFAAGSLISMAFADKEKASCER